MILSGNNNPYVFYLDPLLLNISNVDQLSRKKTTTVQS